MNIFATSLCPTECAQALDDKRVVKMIVETAQMLSTAVRIAALQQDKPLPDDTLLNKTAMPNHPCNIWARECRANFDWLLLHGNELIKEYRHRYKNRIHLSQSVLWELTHHRHLIPAGDEMTEFADCSQTSRFDLPVTERYRICLLRKWQVDLRRPRWTKRDKPDWS